MKPSDHQAAPSAPAIPTTTVVCLMPLDDLKPSPANPRRIDLDDPKLAELANSLKTLGQIEPIVVRKVEVGGWKDGDEGGKLYDYVILAGERRWRAAILAGLTTIECKVLECDDRTALEITVVENLQRADLHPLEEARGVRSLLDAGWPIDEIAAHLGKSAGWVAMRAKLTELSPVWTAGLAKGKWPWAGVAHLEQVARLPVEIQDQVGEHYDHCYEISAKDLERAIAEKYLHHLSSASWKMDDAGLVSSAGACNVCPKRSSCQQSLFADLTGKDRCLDAVCWSGKVQAQTARKATELRASNERVVVLVDRRAEKPDVPRGVTVLEDNYAIIECKKSDAGAVPAVRAESGRAVWVKSETFADNATKAALGAPIKAPKGGGRSAGSESGGSAKVEAARRDAKRFKLRMLEIAAAKEKAKRPGTDLLIRLLVILCIDHQSDRRTATWETIASTKRSAADDLDALWDHVREALPEEYEQVMSTTLPDLEAVQACERLVGLDPAKQAEKALEEIPEPVKRAKAVPASAKAGSGKVAKPKAKAAPAKRLKQAKANIRKGKGGKA
jgi:ParB/RepB/Spo0J family partition protein